MSFFSIGLSILVFCILFGILYFILKKVVYEGYDAMEDPKQYTYDPTTVDIQYHDTLDDLNYQGSADISFVNADGYDSSGKKVGIPVLPLQVSPMYISASNLHPPSSYVPSYEDSVYFSKSSGLSTVDIIGPDGDKWCTNYNQDPTAKELKCNRLHREDCQKSKCCILLGGTKCVAGNENGPFRRANYLDPTIPDKSKYYHDNKCYGSCDGAV